MKILVTGGAGFIGSNFILYWLKNHPQDEIVNLDKLTYAGNLENLKEVENNPNYKFVHGDIVNGEIVDQVMKDSDLVVSFAAETHVDRSIMGPAEFIRTNVVGTQVLLDAAVHYRTRFHHVSCYDEKTLTLTKEGLKTYDKIKPGDLVLTLNTYSNEIEWKPVEKVIVQNYEGTMIKIKSKTVDLVVTPNHRMLVQIKKSKKIAYKIAEELKKEAINKIPKYYQWTGERSNIIKKQEDQEDFMYLMGIFIGDGFIAYQEKKIDNLSGFKKEDYIKNARNKLGQFTSIGKRGNEDYSVCKSWRIFIDIPENDKCRKRCETALTNLGIEWHSQKGKSGEHIYFTSKEFFNIFKQCGKGAKNKKIPPWVLESSQELLKPLLEGLLDSDGSNKRSFSTSSKRLAHQYVELCVKIGLSPCLKEMYKTSKIGNRELRGHIYFISFGKEWRSVRKEIIKECKYKGKIWCLKVKDNRNFLSMRNGKTIFCGNTDEVFGSLSLDSKEKFDEKTPYDPKSPYSASKASSDHLVKAYYHTYGLPITITNSSNNYGPYQFPEKLIPLAITNLIEKKKVPVYGDGLYVRDWLYVEDHVRAIEKVLEKGKIGETYCVGGLTENINNITVVKKILKLLNKTDDEIEYVKDRQGHDRRYAVDWSKIQKELGWKPQNDFDTWLEKTVVWYKTNIGWWKKIKTGEYQNYYKKQYGS